MKDRTTNSGEELNRPRARHSLNRLRSRHTVDMGVTRSNCKFFIARRNISKALCARDFCQINLGVPAIRRFFSAKYLGISWKSCYFIIILFICRFVRRRCLSWVTRNPYPMGRSTPGCATASPAGVHLRAHGRANASAPNASPRRRGAAAPRTNLPPPLGDGKEI